MTELFKNEEEAINWLNARTDAILNSSLDDKIINTWLILDGWTRGEIIRRVINKLCESGRERKECLKSESKD